MSKPKRIVASTTEVVTGITLNLGNDDATHLSFALSCLAAAMKEGHTIKNGLGREWDWLNRLRAELEQARGVGCTMGPRANKEG